MIIDSIYEVLINSNAVCWARVNVPSCHEIPGKLKSPPIRTHGELSISIVNSCNKQFFRFITGLSELSGGLPGIVSKYVMAFSYEVGVYPKSFQSQTQ